MRRGPVAVFLGVMLVVTSPGAYEVETHRDISGAAAIQSVLGTDQNVLLQLGLRQPLDSNRPEQMYNDSQGNRQTVLDLIRNGSVLEDDFPPGPIYHFFDPRTNSQLFINPKDYPDAFWGYVIAIDALTRTSPDWVVLGQGSVKRNNYSFPKARDYFLAALTSPINEERQANFGLLFESLGRIIHHIEDMAQPQHVRNDNHLSYGRADRACSSLLDYKDLCESYRALRRESAYETWTVKPEIRRTLPMVGYAPIYPGVGAPPDGLAVFTTPRRFWTNDGKGMAEYTNRNFFSAGTLDQSPPFTDTPFDVDMFTLCRGANPPCGRLPPADEYVTFIPSYVDDQFRPDARPALNPYAKSVSIFDPEFQSYASQRLPGVNRFTFAKDYEFLIPRAVGYSAGLINYFFRGSMEISLPDEGVYGIVDHSDTGCSNPCGFRALKLKLKNVTAGNGQPNQGQMGSDDSTGNLWAVAKYHLNMCYQPDLSGEDGGSHFNGNSCRSANEYVSVSAPHPIGILSPDQPQQLTFDFGATPIPINASDVFLQVVFRGRLGLETDAVAVATKDISEPTYYGLENVTDYVFDDLGDQQYHPLEFQAGSNKIDVTDIRIAFGPNADTAITIAGLDVLHGGEHARLALLMDRGPQQDSISWKGAFERPPDVVQFDPGEFTQDDTGDAAGIYQRNCDLVQRRGLYMERGTIFVQRAHGISDWRQIQSERPHVTNSSSDANSAGVVQPMVARDPRCSHAPIAGMNDLSTMTPLTSETAKRWDLHF